MAQRNVRNVFTETTHEGAPAARANTVQQLRRSVMSCLLWERGFYEDGESIATRITELAEKVDPNTLASIAIEARNEHNLRHVPLLLLSVLAKTGSGSSLVSETVEQVIQRADELAELLYIYWSGHDRKVGPKPISSQLKKGLAKAFNKFDEYQLAKYDRAKSIRISHVMRAVRPKPKNDEQAALWKRLLEGDLKIPDTWETSLSMGLDKRKTFERLLNENKLGYMALLRNLRKMAEVEVDENLIREAITARKGAHRVLPFRYVAAVRACPRFDAAIDGALLAAIKELPVLSGTTLVLVDVSASMYDKLSARSDLTRMDAAAALASLINGDRRVFSFSDDVVEVPPRSGLAGIDAITKSQYSAGTYLGLAVKSMNEISATRLIVISDEQSHDPVPEPNFPLAYMVNIASDKNGVGYGRWTHIDGFSENIIRFICETERENGLSRDNM